MCFNIPNFPNNFNIFVVCEPFDILSLRITWKISRLTETAWFFRQVGFFLFFDLRPITMRYSISTVYHITSKSDAWIVWIYNSVHFKTVPYEISI